MRSSGDLGLFGEFCREVFSVDMLNKGVPLTSLAFVFGPLP